MRIGNDPTNSDANGLRFLVSLLPFAAASIYYLSNPSPKNYYDYTFQIADRLLHGAAGVTGTPPRWLNEFVPLDGVYYSTFPLGAVLSMIPFAILRELGVIIEMPGTFIAALLAGLCCHYLLKIADKYGYTPAKKILIVFSILFGTWMWTNLTLAGAWQLALGFAMLGELGAIYFTVFDRKPLIAGTFFALAFGNRTEILLTAPVFLYLLSREDAVPDRVNAEKQVSGKEEKRRKREPEKSSVEITSRRRQFVNFTRFSVIPFFLGTATLLYNYIRFHSFADFGYARIPGVLNEPWYNHGIFSFYYVPRQAWEMLGKMWQFKNTFPYFVPDGFSSSILLSSPFLFFLLRPGACDRSLKYASWTAIAILTFLLWLHGNSGGWQFGYRYAMVLLPWIFVILLENSPKRITPVEWLFYGFSFVMNLYATWLFHWTEYLKL